MTAVEPHSLPRLHLNPGALLVTRQAQWVVTVLGSCVAVTMFDRASGLAAICHAMLPRAPGSALPASDDEQRLRYVGQVLPAMLALFQDRGVRRGRIETKLFGGANMFTWREPRVGDYKIGEANVAAVRQLLEREGLQVAAENTGGRRGRKIFFNTGTGEVLHQFIR